MAAKADHSIRKDSAYRFQEPVRAFVIRLHLGRRARTGSLIGLVSYRVTLVTGAPGLPISTLHPVQVITTTPTATVTPGFSLPPLPVTGACVPATASACAVNIRASTSTDSAIIAQMNFNLTPHTWTFIVPPAARSL